MTRSCPIYIIAVIALVAVASPASAAIRYVKGSASGANNGTSWTDAYTSLQQALVDAIAGDEIWVAFGTYKPSSPGGRSSTFQLRNNIAIYGGFRGQSGDEGTNNATTRPPDPDPATANPATDSVLSGDLNGNDGPNFANNGDNVYHVVTGNSTDSTAQLTGFTIKGGNANLINGVDDRAGGFRNESGNAGIQDCRFIANASLSFAGAAFNASSTSTYTNCLFLGNAAPRRGGAANASSTNQFINCTFQSNECVDGGAEGLGGAVVTGGTPSFVGCVFKNNVGRRGGAIHAESTVLNVKDCVFDTNYAHNGGGAIYMNGISGSIQTNVSRCDFVANEAASNSSNGGAISTINGATLRCINCRFVSNQAITGASASGGAIYHDGGAASITNCVISTNSASHGAALYNMSGSMTVVNTTLFQNGALAISNSCGSSIEMYNSIVWGNGSPVLEGCGPTVAFSDFQGGYTGNLDVNPRFMDADGPDNVAGNLDDNLRLAPFSRCIDAGRNADVPPDTADLDGDTNTAEQTPLDLNGSARFINSPYICDTGSGSAPLVDMGAYENNGVWATPGILFVKQSASGANNGTSWTDPFTSLQTPLAVVADVQAACPSTPFQIWIAHCGCNPAYMPGPNRSDSYVISTNNLSIYGGFTGTETNVNQRIPGSRTAISGNIGAFGSYTDNNFHVFRINNSVNQSVLLDGLGIADGYADGGGADSQGAGIYCLGSPRIQNCTIGVCGADSGGAIYTSSGSPVISKSLLSGNSANYGGAIYADGSVDVVNTELRSNSAAVSGGALLVASPVTARLTNCLLTGNAAQFGAGVYQGVSGATSNIVNCSIVENRQVYYNCTTCGGVGIWCNGGNVTVSNSILWGNRGLQQYAQWNQLIWSAGTLIANRCSIQGFFGGITGSGCFGDDPRLRDPDGVNNVSGDFDDNLRLLSISPCIDRGNETLLPPDVADLDGDNDTTEPVPYDLAGNPRRYDVPDVADFGVGTPPLVDVGAYEFSMGDTYICVGGKCLGDLNHDGNIDGLDIPIFVAAVLAGAACP